MAEASKLSTSMAGVAQEEDAAAYQAFHEYQWDLDKDFLGGLVLALGGYHALAQTASQADIIMHSRLFYYARVRGVTIPYVGYRQWLRNQYLINPAVTRIWEWHLLHNICNHRDRLVAASNSSSTESTSSSSPTRSWTAEAVAGEQTEWMRDLLETGPPANASLSAAAADGASEKCDGSRHVTAPAWMVAAPKGDLYVDRHPVAGIDDGPDQVPYPEQFAAIIKAVQSGEQIEGIVEIPDIVARNPTTTPFGRMTRPVKPWEKTQPGQDQNSTIVECSLEHSIGSSFPKQEDPPNSVDLNP